MSSNDEPPADQWVRMPLLETHHVVAADVFASVSVTHFEAMPPCVALENDS